jgi:hypothetical protein
MPAAFLHCGAAEEKAAIPLTSKHLADGGAVACLVVQELISYCAGHSLSLRFLSPVPDEGKGV